MKNIQDTFYCPECGDEFFPDQRECKHCGYVKDYAEYTGLQLIEKNKPLKKVSHLNRRRQMIADTLINILALLKWDEMKYCSFKYQTGLTYIYYVCNGDNGLYAILEQSKSFWTWWRNQWQLRDESFVESCVDIITHGNRLRVYYSLHDARLIYNDITPNNIVFEDSYADMISGVHKELTDQINKP